jgi:hypothetical protein
MRDCQFPGISGPLRLNTTSPGAPGGRVGVTHDRIGFTIRIQPSPCP